MTVATTARVSTKSQLVLPKEVREALGLRPQSEVIFLIRKGAVKVLAKPEDYAAALWGLHAGMGPDDLDAWLAEERSAWDENR